MNPALVFESLYVESTPFKLVFWAAVVTTGAAVLQWLVQGSSPLPVTITPMPSVSVSSTYASPYGFPQTVPPPPAAPAPQQQAQPLKPRSRPAVEAVLPPSGGGTALTPKARPELEGIIVEPPKRGLAPKPRPDLGD